MLLPEAPQPAIKPGAGLDPSFRAAIVPARGAGTGRISLRTIMVHHN